MELTKREMLNIAGGSVSWGTVSIIGGVISFIIGIISGYTNPTRCNN